MAVSARRGAGCAIALFGPPGAGKGTQAARIVERFGFAHLASGDLLRSEIARGTELGREAEQIIRGGNLVSDQIINRMMAGHIEAAIEQRGRVLLDGYPRTLDQLEHLEEFLCERNGRGLELLLYLHVEDSAILRRLLGRLTCRRCGAVYHEEAMPPRVAGVCDQCGGELARRSDDTPESVRERLAVYHRQTQPILERLAGRGCLTRIDAEGDPERVFEQIDARVERLLAARWAPARDG